MQSLGQKVGQEEKHSRSREGIPARASPSRSHEERGFKIVSLRQISRSGLLIHLDCVFRLSHGSVIDCIPDSVHAQRDSFGGLRTSSMCNTMSSSNWRGKETLDILLSIDLITIATISHPSVRPYPSDLDAPPLNHLARPPEANGRRTLGTQAAARSFRAPHPSPSPSPSN